MEDGILGDPRECGFEVADLPVCAGSEQADHCLTLRQREAIAAVYGGPRNASGQIYPGFPYGGEFSGGWQGWITGPNSGLFNAFGEPVRSSDSGRRDSST